MKKKAIYIIIILVVSIVIKEAWSYHIKNKRAENIRTEFKVGMPAEQIPLYLENNKKRLSISEWSQYGNEKEKWFIVSIKSPFSFFALFEGKGGLVIYLDENNKTIKEIQWFM